MSQDPIVDPPRLSDEGSEAPEFLRNLLNRAHGDGATREELRDVASALGPILGAAAGGGAMGGAASGGAGVSAAAGKAGVAGTAAGAVSAGVSGGLVGVAKVTLAAGALIAASVAAVMLISPEDGVSPTTITVDERGASAASPETEVPFSESPTAATLDELSAHALRDEHTKRRRRGYRRPAATSEPAVAADLEVAEPLAEPSELDLLETARAQKRRNPSAALAALREHESRYPRGTLAQERMVLIVDVLLHLGRTEQARTSAQDFLRRFPSSVHRRRVEALLSGQAPD